VAYPALGNDGDASLSAATARRSGPLRSSTFQWYEENPYTGTII